MCSELGRNKMEFEQLQESVCSELDERSFAMFKP